ncbi:MAG: PPC domain-containing protein [Aulosira sp. ZfuVER01]|nr:PPC domain-containing protein [Aulosira sp. ZfuVER01]MDZ8001902.1 PPC domain-containing protein [Aulosira sp. DedVER01a]MDZ8055318.1 PPC domain-containing protein [Aulosira sp. ZfuCHP01]
MQFFEWLIIFIVTLSTVVLEFTARGVPIQEYNPIPLQTSTDIKDKLSEKDIPTGKEGFARDYIVHLEKGDRVKIELQSDVFDTFATLLDMNGFVVAENDDGPDGTTNSLLNIEIVKSGNYIIRVTAVGKEDPEKPSLIGPFTLQVTRLNR